MADAEDEIRKAIDTVLKVYDIELEEAPPVHPSADFSDLISHAQTQIDRLTEKAEEIYKRTGMTREQLEAYASNRNNFTEEQWDALQKVKDACEKYKKEAKQMLPKFEERVEKPKVVEKQPQRFSKKKRWIPS